MKNKDQAIKWFKRIQNGSGVDTSIFPDILKGSIARDKWGDSLFTYGIEYGVLIALIKIFDIKLEDLEPSGEL